MRYFSKHSIAAEFWSYHAEISQGPSFEYFVDQNSAPCSDFATGASFDENITVSPFQPFATGIFGAVYFVPQHFGLGCSD